MHEKKWSLEPRCTALKSRWHAFCSGGGNNPNSSNDSKIHQGICASTVSCRRAGLGYLAICWPHLACDTLNYDLISHVRMTHFILTLWPRRAWCGAWRVHSVRYATALKKRWMRVAFGFGVSDKQTQGYGSRHRSWKVVLTCPSLEHGIIQEWRLSLWNDEMAQIFTLTRSFYPDSCPEWSGSARCHSECLWIQNLGRDQQLRIT